MIVVDIEASGLDPARHAIVSIGAVDFLRPERRFYQECRIWEGAQVQDEALKVNGFTVEQITDPAKSSQEEILGAFIAWLKEADDRTLGGQNTGFDRDFLQMSAERCHLEWYFGHRVLDLHSVAWGHMTARGIQPPLREGRSALSADAIYPYVGMPKEPKPHIGLTGALMEAEAFSRLIYASNLLPEFAQYPVPSWPAPRQPELL